MEIIRISEGDGRLKVKEKIVLWIIRKLIKISPNHHLRRNPIRKQKPKEPIEVETGERGNTG